MSSTSMISKVETVLSLQNNPKEFKNQSMKNNRKLDEQVISDLKLKGQLSELNHQQSYSLIGQHSMGGRRQMETRTNCFSSEESSYNSTDSGHCTQSESIDKGREDLAWKGVEPSSKVKMLGNRRSHKTQSNEFVRRSWQHRRQENKIIIRIRSDDTSETVPPRHHYSFNTLSHERRISTDSQGTVSVPVPFVPDRGLECFQTTI